jgi:uncharacterized iron-regulated membrane protein
MTLTEQAIVWSAVLIAILLIIMAAGTYWIWRKRAFPAESSQLRVERAYRAATNQAIEKVPANQP